MHELETLRGLLKTALAASLRLKANTGLAARVIRVARVNTFIGRDLVGRDGLGNEGFDWCFNLLFHAACRDAVPTMSSREHLSFLPVASCNTH